MMADRGAREEKHRQFVYRMDTAHILVITGDLPKAKPYHVLGNLEYSEPFSTDAIDTARIQKRLKDMALARFPDQADAVIEVNTQVEPSGDTATVTITGEVVQFDSSADRTLMHKMDENTGMNPVVSPK